jgi:hypothetical protein
LTNTASISSHAAEEEWVLLLFIALIQFLLAFAEPEPEIVEYMMECGSPIDARTIYSAVMGHYRFKRS